MRVHKPRKSFDRRLIKSWKKAGYPRTMEAGTVMARKARAKGARVTEEKARAVTRIAGTTVGIATTMAEATAGNAMIDGSAVAETDFNAMMHMVLRQMHHLLP
jgi:hypothetical protein